jgi:signal transduction histidine kinase
VHRAIEAHRGAILVDSQSGHGARFKIYLPAHSGRRN